MKEADLYIILEQHYRKKGYDVKGEVCGCDLVAMKGDELIIVELKLHFNVKLLYQAVRRLLITEQVYVAIPRPTSKIKMSYWTMVKSLSRRLHLGLILIDGIHIKFLTKPSPFQSKIYSAPKKKLLAEFKGRRVGKNLGGTTGKKLITAYLESSIQIATMLAKHRKSSAVKLREMGASENAHTILYNNHYNWFEKKERGIYGLKRGSKSRIKKQYQNIWEYYEKDLTD